MDFKWMQTCFFKNMGIFGAPGSEMLYVHIYWQVEPCFVGKERIIKSDHSTLCETKKPTAELCMIMIITRIQFLENRAPIWLKL